MAVSINFDCSFFLIAIWRQTVWNYLICSVIVGDIDFKMNNNTISERTLIEKKMLPGKGGSIIIPVSIYMCVVVHIYIRQIYRSLQPFQIKFSQAKHEKLPMV